MNIHYGRFGLPNCCIQEGGKVNTDSVSTNSKQEIWTAYPVSRDAVPVRGT